MRPVALPRDAPARSYRVPAQTARPLGPWAPPRRGSRRPARANGPSTHVPPPALGGGRRSTRMRRRVHAGLRCPRAKATPASCRYESPPVARTSLTSSLRRTRRPALAVASRCGRQGRRLGSRPSRSLSGSTTVNAASLEPRVIPGAEHERLVMWPQEVAVLGRLGYYRSLSSTRPAAIVVDASVLVTAGRTNCATP